MKGLQPLFLGIFGIFAFSWLGMTVVPNLQIGSLNPQTDEEGTDIYPAPPSGMALRGAQVYAANGCVYCHSQQVRPEYGGSDLERKWGERRSAPRDYIFQPIVFLGKMRTGPDLANVGNRPALDEKGAATPAPADAAAAAAAPAAAATSPAAGASPAGSSEAAPAGDVPAPAVAAGSPVAGPSPAADAGATPAVAASPAAGASPAVVVAPVQPATTSAPAGSPAATVAAAATPAPTGSAAPAASPTAVAITASPAQSPAPGAAGVLPAAGDQPAANVATSAPSLVENVEGLTADGTPLPYTAAWHHRHLFDPRSIVQDSNMPAFRFLYEKRRISGVRSPDAINFAGDNGENLESGWEIVPSYDAKCLVAYLMSLDQSHPLKEAKSPVALAPAPAKEAQK